MKRGALLIVLAVASLFAACTPNVIRGGTGAGDTGGDGGSGTGGSGAGGGCTTADDCSYFTFCLECPGSGAQVCDQAACVNGQCEMFLPACPGS